MFGSTPFVRILCSKELSPCFVNISFLRSQELPQTSPLVQLHGCLLNASSLQSCIYCFFTHPPPFHPSLKLLCSHPQGLHHFLEGTAITHVLLDILSIQRHCPLVRILE